MMRAAAAAVVLLLATIAPANASLRLCNRTSYVIYAATATVAGDASVKGWTRIVPGQCRTAIDGDLAARAYYLYARSSPAHSGEQRAWSGNAGFCIGDSDFAFHQAQAGMRCAAPGAFAVPFAVLDTHHMRSWTATFREAPDLPSMPAAEHAGLVRLMADLGIHGVAAPGAFDKTLAQFRLRLKLPQKADAGTLFDALETQAMRVSVPTGYTLCNDTKQTLWAAVAMKKDPGFVSRGWWAVASGACARLIAQPVTSTPVYLRVEKDKNSAVIEGTDTFCVTGIEFEIEGRERCAARGYSEAGFMPTNSGGAPGYAAHVSASGLAGRAAYAGTSK